MAGRYTGNRDSRTLNTGGVLRIDVSEIERLPRVMGLAYDGVLQAEHYTASDALMWAPGKISTATAQVYNLRKSEVAQIRTKYDAVAGEYRGRGRNTGKGAVRVSRGDFARLADFKLIFRGRKHAGWTTRANSSTKRPPRARVKYVTAAGKKSSKPKPYVTTVETHKGKRTPIVGRGGNRAFVLQRNGGLVAVVARKGERMPWVHGSSSVPQAILNPQVVAIWEPQLGAYLLKRFEHHAKRALSGAAYNGVRNGKAWTPRSNIAKIQRANARSWARANAKYRPPAGAVNGLNYRSPHA